jgi:hypothetical protein
MRWPLGLAWMLLAGALAAAQTPPPAAPPAELPPPFSTQKWPEVLDGQAGSPAPWPDHEAGLPVFVTAEAQVLQPMLQRWSTSGLVGAEVLRYPRNFALDWTLAPEVSLGYRLWDRFFLVGRYRYYEAFGRRERPADFPLLFPDAAADILALGDGDPNFAGLRAQRAEFQMHLFDLGVAALDRRSAVGLWRFDAAARFAQVSSRLDSVWFNQQPFLAPGITEIPLVAGQQARHRFDGLGPQLGIEGTVPLLPHLNLLARVEGGLLIGEAEHAYAHQIELLTLQHLASGVTTGPALAPNFRLQVGLHWQWYVGCSVFELTAGYQFEKWWFIGVEDDLGVRGYYPSIDLQNHGPYVRAMLRF